VQYIGFIEKNFLKKGSKKLKICIIGGGLVGSYFVKIARQKFPNAFIEVIEIGAKNISERRKDIAYEPIFTNKKYIGALGYIYFGLGGTTNLSTGQLLPFSKIDTKISNEFIFIFNVCQRYSKVVLHQLNIRFYNFNQNIIKNNFFSIKSIWVSPFKRTFKKFLKYADSLHINAYPVDFKIYNNYLKSISIQNATGKTEDISADYFLITAGAIESSRLLLEIEQILCKNNTLSKKLYGLSDHITFPIALVKDWSKYKFLKKYEPNFRLLNLTTYRFIDSESLRPVFYNFLYNYQKNTNFKNILIFLEKFQKLSFIEFINQLKFAEIISILRSGLILILRQKLPNSSKLPIMLHCDYAQDGSLNSIELRSEKESCGRKSLEINWSINEVELKSIYEECLIKVPQLMSELEIDNYRLLGYDEIIDPKNGFSQLGAAHPAGLSPTGKGLIDENLKVLGIKNLYSISSAILPSSGTVNPTFSLLCLVHFLLDFIFLENKKNSLI
jgi:hypothetical protein